jgi:hypothetical protein
MKEIDYQNHRDILFCGEEWLGKIMNRKIAYIIFEEYSVFTTPIITYCMMRVTERND